MSQFEAEWELVWNATVHLHAEIDDFRFLFTDEGNFRLMKETAPGFFGRLRMTMWNSLLLQLCRLTDPAETGPKHDPKSNLSLVYLLARVEEGCIGNCNTEAAQLVNKADALSKFARSWRNLRIAHRDLSNATGTKSCATATLADVDRAAAAIGAAVDALSPDGVQTLWKADLYKRDTQILLHYLSEGERSDATRHKAYVEGKLPWGKMWWDDAEN